jgi:hypothetical protein
MSVIHHPRPWTRHLLALACGLTAAAALAACDGAGVDISGGTSPTASGSPTPAASTTSTPTATTTEAIPSTEERLQELVLGLLTDRAAADEDALAQIEVVALPLGGATRDLWAAVSSGPGIWELQGEARHVLAIYERRSDGSLVEVSVLTLESEPTIADLEVVPGIDPDGANVWVAVHGFTGAHSGTFELVRFDGVALTSALWWFSPSPGAATLEDLDGDGVAEVVLDATDPYVYCYACGVRASAEIIYRWVDGEPTAVNIAAVESDDQRVVDLTEVAALYANANLWRHARSTMQLAADAAPDDPEVRWLRIAIERTATLRLTDAGSEPQPLVTNVLAGDFDAAVTLMEALTPAEAFDPVGPLFAGTVAEGWEDVTAGYLVDYANAALEVQPTMASGYVVRALGRVLVAPEDWATALMDMEAALAIEPDNVFYQAAEAYLRERNGGASG